MVDIAQKPYYSYVEIIHKISKQIQNLANIKLVNFVRFYPNLEKFVVDNHKEWTLDFFTRHKLYKWGLYERDYENLQSGFHMHDHLPFTVPEIFDFLHKQHNLSHGMHILQQHRAYVDLFVFATAFENNQVNNFYLNQKDLFIQFMNDFYEELNSELIMLSNHKFIVPQDIFYTKQSFYTLSSRQYDCSRLLVKGLKTKEIARLLQISPRTVETHISILMAKLKVKNRAQLTYTLSKLL